MKNVLRVCGLVSAELEKELNDRMGKWPQRPNSCLLFISFAEQDVPVGSKFIGFKEEGTKHREHAIWGELVQVTQSYFVAFDGIPKGHKTICEIVFDRQSRDLLRSMLPSVNSWYDEKRSWFLKIDEADSPPSTTQLQEWAIDGDLEALQNAFASDYSQADIDSSLECAIAYSQLETAEYLLSLGADLSANGWNGIYYAAHNGELAGLKFAIANGIDINVDNGMLLNTAVESACNSKSTEIVTWLLDNGGDQGLITQRSIGLAMEWGNEELKEIVRPLQQLLPEPVVQPRKVSPWWKFWD